MYCPLAVVWSLSRTQVLALLAYQKPGWVPSVWYTMRPGAGAGTLPVPMARRAASVRRGSRAPLLLLAISSAAEASGAVVPMPTPDCAWTVSEANDNSPRANSRPGVNGGSNGLLIAGKKGCASGIAGHCKTMNRPLIQLFHSKIIFWQCHWRRLPYCCTTTQG